MSWLQFGEIEMSQKDGNHGNDNQAAPRKRERDNGPKPLIEEVEEEMEDQDIPVETGVRPANEKR
jgi:hypothetical protein